MDGARCRQLSSVGRASHRRISLHVCRISLPSRFRQVQRVYKSAWVAVAKSSVCVIWVAPKANLDRWRQTRPLLYTKFGWWSDVCPCAARVVRHWLLVNVFSFNHLLPILGEFDILLRSNRFKKNAYENSWKNRVPHVQLTFQCTLYVLVPTFC